MGVAYLSGRQTHHRNITPLPPYNRCRLDTVWNNQRSMSSAAYRPDHIPRFISSLSPSSTFFFVDVIAVIGRRRGCNDEDASKGRGATVQEGDHLVKVGFSEVAVEDG